METEPIEQPLSQEISPEPDPEGRPKPRLPLIVFVVLAALAVAGFFLYRGRAGGARLALVTVLGLGAIVQQRNAARQVIEYKERCRRGKRGIGNVRLRLSIPRQAFEQPHDVVARHADQPAREWQTLHFGLRARCPAPGRKSCPG